MRRFAQQLLTVVVSVLWLGSCRPAEPITVMSFNVRYASVNDGDNCWANRAAAVALMLDSLRPDLLGLQEALAEQVEFFDTNLCDRYGRIGVGRDDGKLKGEMMAVYWNRERFELLDGGTFWLSPTPDSCSFGWDAACRRTATWVELREISSARRLLFVNTHFDHKGVVAELNSAALIRDFIVEKGNKRFVLTGDLNVTSEDVVLEPFASFGNARRDARLTDDKPSFNAFGAADAEQIDYIYYGGFEAELFRTVDDDWGVPYISDHYPVTAVLR